MGGSHAVFSNLHRRGSLESLAVFSNELLLGLDVAEQVELSIDELDAVSHML